LGAAQAHGFTQRSGFADGEVFTHFFQPFFADASDREQVIDTLERAVRFAHLQNFVSGCRTDPGDLLELFGIAVLMLIGLSGGFLVVPEILSRTRQNARKPTINRGTDRRHFIAPRY
jgi:hypothetical protein